MPIRSTIVPPLLLLLVAVAFGIGQPVAHAAWATTGSGTAGVDSGVLPAGSTPTVTTQPAGDPVVYELRWASTELAPAAPATGYRVLRTGADGIGVVVTDGSCAGSTQDGVPDVVVPADPAEPEQTCTDTGAASLGPVTYTVQPVFLRWLGTPSTPSLAHG